MKKSSERFRPREPNLCPKCGVQLMVGPRGSDFIAYCPGEHGYDGCSLAEFGEDPQAAVAALMEQHEINGI